MAYTLCSWQSEGEEPGDWYRGTFALEPDVCSSFGADFLLHVPREVRLAHPIGQWESNYDTPRCLGMVYPNGQARVETTMSPLDRFAECTCGLRDTKVLGH